MRQLFDQIPLEQSNTSMTINAPAAWLLAMYVALADEQGADRKLLQGTTQNDLIKEYLSRGTYIFPPGPSLRLIGDMIAWCYREVPKWNPMNVCSYHLQEAGATPEQELAFALATAISVLDTVKAGGQVPEEDFEIVASRISFFVNAGVRFVTELCKMRSFTRLWDQILLERYGVQDKKARRFRYGVQVNSLGLTEQQPENNVYRILIEALAVTLSKDARCRALQLPAWNEALGLPRPFDQQWSLRLQQVLAYETDLLEYEDLFDGSHVVEAKVAELSKGALEQLALIDDGRRPERHRLHEDRAGRLQRQAGALGRDRRHDRGRGQPLDRQRGLAAVGRRKQHRDRRSAPGGRRGRAAEGLARGPRSGRRRGRPGRPEGRRRRWPQHHGTLDRRRQGRRHHRRMGRRPARGVRRISRPHRRGGRRLDRRGRGRRGGEGEVERVSQVLGRTLTYLVGKPGLDGHSNGAEQIATRARACGMEVIYDGIRSTPEEIVRRAKEGRAHVVGLSILSGSHLDLVQEVIRVMRAEGLGHIPVVAGGIIPEGDALILKQMGVARIYTPKDFKITEIMGDVVRLVEEAALAETRGDR
jgi:(2R)-ethylmalonyl-CoA mutase